MVKGGKSGGNMAAVICLLRGVNVGGRGTIKMSDLKTLFENLGFDPVHTVLQSGNVVFGAKSASLPALAKTIAAAMKQELNASPDVILRTPKDMRAVVQANPFGEEARSDPSHLVVQFLHDKADKAAQTKLDVLAQPPEKFVIAERKVYLHYPHGLARSKLGGPAMDKALGSRGTARNWNTILKLLELAEAIG
jgi:uncharacterized protein (DUF1697 family)